MSHSNSFTGKTGTLIPVLCEELLPNDTISLGSQLQVQLPPMVTDFYGRVDFVLEAFFVPNRLLWAGWQDFITHPTANPVYPNGTNVAKKPTEVPYFKKYTTTGSTIYDVPVTSLLHYLDYGSQIYFGDDLKPSVLKAFAYHRIWDDWYRDSRVQAPLFYPATSINTGSTNVLPAHLPYVSCRNDGSAFTISLDSGDTFTDNVKITSLRQRNWVKDYFTTAAPLPQAGGASEVQFDVSSAQETGAFTISTLRAANSLQKWMERNNLAGYRYSDQIYAQFGVYPSDAIMDRALYLGRNVQTVYNRSVFSTVDASSEPGN